MFYVNAAIICVTIGLLPDWTINEFVVTYMEFLTWVLVHGIRVAISAIILLFLIIIFSFRERVAMAAGVEHVKFFRFGKMNIFRRQDLHIVSYSYYRRRTLYLIDKT